MPEKTADKKPDRVQQALSEIHALRGAPREPRALERLRQALADKSSFVVAAAAEVIGAAEVTELASLLPAAFARFLISPEKSDKGCKAKLAIADALYRTGSRDESTFRRGLRHVQKEPVWGGTQDTAAELRGLCGMALVQLGALDAIEEMGDLLADPEPTARLLCARALGSSGREEALPLLRYKVRIGDTSGEVLMECFAALLSLAPQRALPVIAELLEQGESARCEAAVLALGQSRHEEALPLLVRFAEEGPMEQRRVALVAMAMLRSPASLAQLLALVASGPLSLAMQAVQALAMHRYDDSLRRRVEEAARRRGDAALLRASAEAFTTA